MRPVRFAEYENAFRGEVREAVVGLGSGDAEVRDVRLSLIEDLTGSPAWRVTLVLPRPRGSTWDIDETLDLQDDVRRRIDEIAARRELEADGLTSVVITTDEAEIEDVALEDEPEPEEFDAFDEEPGD